MSLYSMCIINFTCVKCACRTCGDRYTSVVQPCRAVLTLPLHCKHCCPHCQINASSLLGIVELWSYAYAVRSLLHYWTKYTRPGDLHIICLFHKQKLPSNVVNHDEFKYSYFSALMCNAPFLVAWLHVK